MIIIAILKVYYTERGREIYAFAEVISQNKIVSS